MMAKMFYTLDETKGALGLNEEEIKQLSREGRLREFRDGPRLMFKADQVDNLKAELTSATFDLGLSQPLQYPALPHLATTSMAAFADNAQGSFHGWNYLATGFVSDPARGQDMKN